jgi:hypothetical protein
MLRDWAIIGVAAGGFLSLICAEFTCALLRGYRWLQTVDIFPQVFTCFDSCRDSNVFQQFLPSSVGSDVNFSFSCSFSALLGGVKESSAARIAGALIGIKKHMDVLAGTRNAKIRLLDVASIEGHIMESIPTRLPPFYEDQC